MRTPQLFLHDFAPTTTHLAFLKIPVSELLTIMEKRKHEINQLWGFPDVVPIEDVTGSLTHKLHGLLPLATMSTRVLISATQSDWTMYVGNSWRGSSLNQAGYLSEVNQLNYMEVVIRDTSCQFLSRHYENGEVKRRYVYTHKESGWTFDEQGERFSFEEVEHYTNRTIKKRLTVEMIERYCKHFGIELLDPDFYVGEAYVIQSYTPPNTQLFDRYSNVLYVSET